MMTQKIGLALFLVACIFATVGANREKKHEEENKSECDCGPYGLTCSLRDGVKNCLCRQGFKQNGDTCERCDCRLHTKDCVFVDGEMKCTCYPGYIQEDNLCVEECNARRPCQNGGECRGGRCTCPAGVGGRFCQIIAACESEDLCGNGPNVTCKYDVDTHQAYCSCDRQEQVFVKDEKKCQEPCHHSSECQNGRECAQKEEGGFCHCGPGLAGDFCEIPSCDPACLHGTTCEYDVRSENASCVCPRPGEVLDLSEKKCREPCQSNETCQNEAQCIVGQDGIGFCECRHGTDGSFCENLSYCYLCGDGDDVTCEYNVTSMETRCICNDTNKGFDEGENKCRIPCTSHEDCHESMCSKTYEWETVGELEYLYCECPDGISGDSCDVIDGCEQRMCGENNNVTCKYDYILQTAYCQCDDRSLEFDDQEQVCKDCSCGPKTSSCLWSEGKRVCQCFQSYIQEGDQCVDCACGVDSTGCELRDGRKVCLCRSGFDFNGKTCAECNCGPKTRKCHFEDGKKVCDCGLIYVQYGDTCVLGCYEGSCENGGACNETSGLCECKTGTEGTFCDTVTDCTLGRGICGHGIDVECAYDEEAEEAYCECSFRGYVFDEKDRRCKECDCGEYSVCSFGSGVKVCTCIKDYALRDGKCAECVCGANSTGCGFEGPEKICNCSSGYAQKGSSCEACDCGNYGACSFVDDEKKCSCMEGYILKGESCEACDCGKHGTCSLDDDGNKSCSCDKGYSLRNGTCSRECRDDCKNGGTCISKFCHCLPGTSGDQCDIVDDCSLSFSLCVGGNGVCKYNVTSRQAYCECVGDTLFDQDLKSCRKTCSSNGDLCSHGGRCEGRLCRCPNGTSGDYCEVVDGCGALKDTCRRALALCGYDPDKEAKANCFCKSDDFIYDEKQEICVDKWCSENECKGASLCKFDTQNRVGYCQCRNRFKFYDYGKEKCPVLDPCFLKVCGANEACEKGECTCKEGYYRLDDKRGCIPRFCDKDPCPNPSVCEETTVPEAVTCRCPTDMIYHNGFCKSKSCIAPDDAGFCCPEEMQYSNGDCEPKEKWRACKKDCGRGWCIKEGDEETCRCVKGLTELQNGTCIPDAGYLCASGSLTPDASRCDCFGIFKYAKDNFSCEKWTCADQEVQEECRRVGAVGCKDYWHVGERGFECTCGPGQEKDSKGRCRGVCDIDAHAEECSRVGKMCYVDEKHERSCVCRPMFVWNEQEQVCEYREGSAFLLHQLPVMRSRYGSATLDKRALYSDVITSIKSMYPPENLEFVYPTINNLSDDKILTDVIVQFKVPSVFELRRFEKQLLPDTLDGKPVDVLPPRLLLRMSGSYVLIHIADFCNRQVKNVLCGTEAQCSHRTCSCPAGFRTTQGSVETNQNYTILKCEDVDECSEGSYRCPANTKCVNTKGDYYCACQPGFKKVGQLLPFNNPENKEACVDLCSPNPCIRGTCSLKGQWFDCRCNAGFSGSLCDHVDQNLTNAMRTTRIVGGILGGLLIITLVLFIVYAIRRRREKSSSEGAYPSTAELTERPPPYSG